jgi:adenylylsulfate kinase
MARRRSRTVALDFDGVLAQYDGWRGEDHLGQPMPGMRDLVAALERRGCAVVVFTTRPADRIHGWLRDHGFPALEVTNVKERRMVVFLDDRAVRFEPPLVADPEAAAEMLATFRPYWDKR